MGGGGEGVGRGVGLGFRVWGLGLRVWGLGFRVSGWASKLYLRVVARPLHILQGFEVRALGFVGYVRFLLNNLTLNPKP